MKTKMQICIEEIMTTVFSCFISTFVLYLCWNHGVIYININYIHKMSLWHSFLLMYGVTVIVFFSKIGVKK